jgi:hypothetical protein
VQGVAAWKGGNGFLPVSLLFPASCSCSCLKVVAPSQIHPSLPVLFFPGNHSLVMTELVETPRNLLDTPWLGPHLHNQHYIQVLRAHIDTKDQHQHQHLHLHLHQHRRRRGSSTQQTLPTQSRSLTTRALRLSSPRLASLPWSCPRHAMHFPGGPASSGYH